MNKKFITLWAFILPILLISTFQLSAQRNCGAMDHMHAEEQADPHITQVRQQIEAKTQAYINNTDENSRIDGIISIPVVVHVVFNNSTESISDAQVQSQIDVLNADFRRQNTDADATWSQAIDTEIEFCLATIDPNGAATNGITRTSTTVTAFGTNDEMKFNSSGGKDAWPASDYLNMWSCDISGGILGYAQFPGGADATDGVVMDYQYFGTIGTATAPFDLGRTATHEVGHWLNLRHIWGDGACGVDDFVTDTPTSDAANYGCATTHSSCSSLDMVQNYMDYSDDACMNLFTAGQKVRMRALFDAGGAKESLLSSGACGASVPSCTDGVLNQDETGIDCGGATCPACPTCTDGIQNGDELGIDCGGSNCAACAADPCTTFGAATYGWDAGIPTACGVANATQTTYQAWTNEGFIIEGVTANQMYNYNFCTGYDAAVWEGSLTVYSLSGDATAGWSVEEFLGFADGCSVDFTTTAFTNLLIYTNGNADACDAASTETDNGFYQLYCIDTPVSSGLYVDESATGSNDGSDWANAFTDLQDALAIGVNETIHIAEGTYLPTSGTVRGLSFTIPADATLLGGYPAGGGTRDADTYITTLSGNIDGIAGYAGNSYHVVKLQNVTGVMLDGLDIKDGSADDASSFGRARGGGLYAVGSTATISNSTFRRNKAVFGGAIFATTSNLTLDNCIIKLNIAGNGGAIYHSNQTNLYINNCYIVDNNSTVRCAIEVNNSLYTEINNSVIADNASGNANAIAFIATNRDQSCNIYNSTILGETKDRSLISLQVGFGDQLDVNIYNSIIAHQTASFSKSAVIFSNGVLNFNTTNCYVQGSTILGNPTANIYEDVVGAITYGSDYDPVSCSPTEDAGNNANTNSLTTDIAGNDRVVSGTVDIGAHEIQTACGTTREIFNADISIFPNPTSGMIFIKTDLETFNVQVFDILGQVVAQSNVQEINLSHLPLGIYMLNVESNGKIVKTEKIVKK